MGGLYGTPAPASPIHSIVQALAALAQRQAQYQGLGQGEDWIIIYDDGAVRSAAGRGGPPVSARCANTYLSALKVM